VNVTPLTLAAANAFTAREYRHPHRALRFHFWSSGAVKDDKLVGAVVVGPPKARAFTKGKLRGIEGERATSVNPVRRPFGPERGPGPAP